MSRQGKVLVTGGTGLVGTELVPMLLEKGYEVSVLSRSGCNVAGATVYRWDPGKGEVDKNSLKEVKAVVHLAGAGIGDGRWTQRRKNEILGSRVGPARLLFTEMKKTGNLPEAFISASGTGLYDQQNYKVINTEASDPGHSFLAGVVTEWEKAADLFSETGGRVVKLRTGMVLDSDGGALPKMATPVKMGLGSALGSGNQWVSWIHLHDLCHLYCEAIENPGFHGVYNAVAPGCVTNHDFFLTLCKVLDKPFRSIRVPEFVLKTVLGEMSSLMLEGAFCKPERLGNETQFEFRFADLNTALNHLYSAKSA